MRILTLNCNGIRSAHRKGFYDWSKRDPRKRQAEARAKLAEILALLDRQKRAT